MSLKSRGRGEVIILPPFKESKNTYPFTDLFSYMSPSPAYGPSSNYFTNNAKKRTDYSGRPGCTSTQSWNSLNVVSGGRPSRMSHTFLWSNRDVKATAEQYESLESSLSYWIEICLPTVPPTGSSCACWNFRKTNLLLRLHVTPLSVHGQLPCRLKALLSCTRW